jgi:predicted nucleotidyltransferase
MLTRGEIEEKLKLMKPQLKADFFVERLGFFGSFATGDQTRDSDVDILVEFSRPLGWEFFDLKSSLEKELRRNVDLVSIKALKDQLREIILKQTIFV